MKKKVFIWGSGGQARVVLDILKNDKQFDVVAFIDVDEKKKGQIIDGVKVAGGKEALEELRKKNVRATIVAVGDNAIRQRTADYLKKEGFSLINAIHPTAIITSNVAIGENVTIAA